MDPRYLNDDFREFLKCLNDVGVEYLFTRSLITANATTLTWKGKESPIRI